MPSKTCDTRRIALGQKRRSSIITVPLCAPKSVRPSHCCARRRKFLVNYRTRPYAKHFILQCRAPLTLLDSKYEFACTVRFMVFFILMMMFFILRSPSPLFTVYIWMSTYTPTQCRLPIPFNNCTGTYTHCIRADGHLLTTCIFLALAGPISTNSPPPMHHMPHPFLLYTTPVRWL
jgi:hypothetical protein